MSMELYVLSNRRLASVAQWQQAINAEGVALSLSVQRSFEQLAGFLPVTFNATDTGFECDHWDIHDLKTITANINFGRWQYALAFRWGADINAAVAAYRAAAAYARATDGFLFDCEEGKIITPDQSLAIARELERSKPLIEEAVRRGVEQFKSKS